MAKKIIEEPNNPLSEGVAVTTDAEKGQVTEGVSVTVAEKDESEIKPLEETVTEIKTPVADESKSSKQMPVTENFPPLVEAMLKAFPSHEMLYIDSQGGAYTKNSMPCIRGNAVLYKNPYCKS